MAEIRVTYARLQEAANVISSQTKDFRHVMEEIKTTMDTLNGAWASEASMKYHSQFNRLNANFDAYEKALNQYSAYLNKTADEYRTADARVEQDTDVLDNTALFV